MSPVEEIHIKPTPKHHSLYDNIDKDKKFGGGDQYCDILLVKMETETTVLEV